MIHVVLSMIQRARGFSSIGGHMTKDMSQEVINFFKNRKETPAKTEKNEVKKSKESANNSYRRPFLIPHNTEVMAAHRQSDMATMRVHQQHRQITDVFKARHNQSTDKQQMSGPSLKLQKMNPNNRNSTAAQQ
ncbi:hypothetical protein O3M35_011524 [Rhynocoris fuscipes]|uniref:Uncharacterized protein n=1 Tax=Rhynocoris fuscipes TaxID=488301 RepID=A0AAW1CYE7_9HEMI